MTQPGQPPYGPNQPAQAGASQPTSTYQTTGGGAPGQPVGQTGGQQFPGQHPGGQPYPNQPEPGHQGKTGPGFATYLAMLLAIIVAVVVAVFIAQNTDRTTIEFFGTDKSLSLAAALAIALAAGFIIGLLLGLLPALKAKRELRAIRRGNR
jgi:uncharacterized integral membrane protein